MSKPIIHLKPAWNELDQPIWVVATSRRSAVSRLVEGSPAYTRRWRVWGWEIDHSEFDDSSEQLRTKFALCSRCLVGEPETECGWKVATHPRLPSERRRPKRREAADDDASKAAAVLGLTWPLDRSTAADEIKRAFTKAALATHSDRDALEKTEDELKQGDEKMKIVLEARVLLNDWAERWVSAR